MDCIDRVQASVLDSTERLVLPWARQRECEKRHKAKWSCWHCMWTGVLRAHRPHKRGKLWLWAQIGMFGPLWVILANAVWKKAGPLGTKSQDKIPGALKCRASFGVSWPVTGVNLLPTEQPLKCAGIILLLWSTLLHSPFCLFFTFTIFTDLLEFPDFMEINTCIYWSNSSY